MFYWSSASESVVFLRQFKGKDRPEAPSRRRPEPCALLLDHDGETAVAGALVGAVISRKNRMQKWGIAACALAGLALTLSIANAAEIKPVNLKDDSVEISISGNIEPGDIDRLMASIKAANSAGKLVTALRLNSGGGNLLEAVRVADWVKYAKFSTK